MALLIVGILTQNYLSTDVPGGKPFAVTVKDRARAAVASMNLRSAQTQWMINTEGRRYPINQLRTELDKLQNYGSGGRFFEDANGQLQNTLMLETPLFREKYQLVRVR